MRVYYKNGFLHQENVHLLFYLSTFEKKKMVHTTYRTFLRIGLPIVS